MARVRAFSTAGDKIESPVGLDLMAVIWTGSTTAADTCIIKEIGGGRIWEGRAQGTDTYIGVSFNHDTIHVDNGIEVESISSGTVYVYFREA